MTNVRAGVLLGCVALSSACVFSSIDGSGTIVTESRPVSGISSVALGGSGRVIIERTGVESLTVTADDNLLPYISTEVHGGKLGLGFTDGTMNVRPSKDIVFRLTVKQLNGLNISGSGQVDAAGLDDPLLRVAISGSGDVHAQGASEDLDLSISGSGAYRGDGLKTRHAVVSISGSGEAVVAATDTLNAHVSGSGAIEYIGDPQVTERVSGDGFVRRRR